MQRALFWLWDWQPIHSIALGPITHAGNQVRYTVSFGRVLHHSLGG